MRASGEAEQHTTTVMVASLLERPEEGVVFEKVPLHLTYLPWFRLPDDKRDDFDFELNEIIEQNRPPRIMGGSLRLFTDDKTGEAVTVRKIEQMTDGFNVVQDFFVHAALHGFARHVDQEADLRYFGLRWNPHVTSVSGQELQQGEDRKSVV